MAYQQNTPESRKAAFKELIKRKSILVAEPTGISKNRRPRTFKLLNYAIRKILKRKIVDLNKANKKKAKLSDAENRQVASYCGRPYDGLQEKILAELERKEWKCEMAPDKADFQIADLVNENPDSLIVGNDWDYVFFIKSRFYQMVSPTRSGAWVMTKDDCNKILDKISQDPLQLLTIYATSGCDSVFSHVKGIGWERSIKLFKNTSQQLITDILQDPEQLLLTAKASQRLQFRKCISEIKALAIKVRMFQDDHSAHSGSSSQRPPAPSESILHRYSNEKVDGKIKRVGVQKIVQQISR
jgi:hypothetical protein